MSFKHVLLTVMFAVLTVGCSAFKQAPDPDTCEYRPIPAGWLEPCNLPAAPLANGQLSENFVIAMQCAELGNADKAQIRELVTPD